MKIFGGQAFCRNPKIRPLPCPKIGLIWWFAGFARITPLMFHSPFTSWWLRGGLARPRGGSFLEKLFFFFSFPKSSEIGFGEKANWGHDPMSRCALCPVLSSPPPLLSYHLAHRRKRATRLFEGDRKKKKKFLGKKKNHSWSWLSWSSPWHPAFFPVSPGSLCGRIVLVRRVKERGGRRRGREEEKKKKKKKKEIKVAKNVEK